MLLLALLSSLCAAAALPSGGIVQAQGTRFVVDGAPFMPRGVNNYYLNYVQQASVDDLMATAARYGVNVVRCWAYSASDSTGVPPSLVRAGDGVRIDESALRPLDTILASAGRYGIRVILVLANNWDAYRSTEELNGWAGHSFHDEFFTDARTIAWYQAYAQALLTRTNTITGTAYASDPAIFAWQLMNEPRCKGSSLPASPQCSTATISAWVAQQAAFLRTLDSTHLISSGSEGFFAWPGASDWTYSGGEGIDFDALISTDGISYETIHMYPTLWSKDNAWATQFLNDHIAQAAKAGKPVMLEEYGHSDPAQRAALYSAWNKIMCASGGSALWMLGGRMDGGAFYAHGDEFMIVDDGSAASTSALQSIQAC